MRSLFITTLITAAFAQSGPGVDANTLPDVDYNDFVLKTFDNYVDHNDLTKGTYSQRYWEMDTYWTDTNSPNFIYFCGEYVCSPPDERHFPFQVGANMGARLFVIEHRFYGESQPMPDWTVESLQLLNSEQALADFAYFLQQMNSDNSSRQTIVIGGSYPGALSAWFRYTYPDIAVASWASSAVVQPWADMWTYDEQIYDSTYQMSPDCAHTLQRFEDYATTQAILRDAGAPNQIDDILKLTPGDGMRTNDFMAYLGDFPAGYVQYGDAQHFCDIWADYTDMDEYDLFIAAVYYQYNQGDYPWYYNTAPGSPIQSTTIDTTSSDRQWTWQYCREFGWFQVASHIHRVRSPMVDYEYFSNQCNEIFGLDMNIYPDVAYTESQYGGGNRINATNIFFANGVEDPWKWVTQLENRPQINQPSVVSDCVGCAHCAELYTPTAADPQQLKDTRQQVYDWIYAILNPSAATQSVMQ